MWLNIKVTQLVTQTIVHQHTMQAFVNNVKIFQNRPRSKSGFP